MLTFWKLAQVDVVYYLARAGLVLPCRLISRASPNSKDCPARLRGIAWSLVQYGMR
jgi:hypothetical protein